MHTCGKRKLISAPKYLIKMASVQPPQTAARSRLIIIGVPQLGNAFCDSSLDAGQPHIFLCFNWRAAKASDRQVWGLPLSQLHHLQLKTKLRFVFFCGFTNVVVGLCESVKAWGLSQQQKSTFWCWETEIIPRNTKITYLCPQWSFICCAGLCGLGLWRWGAASDIKCFTTLRHS